MVRVTAEASRDNPASTKLLQNAGFKCIGNRVDEDDGFVNLWVASSDTSPGVRADALRQAVFVRHFILGQTQLADSRG